MFEKYSSYGYYLYQPFDNIDQWVIDDGFNKLHGTYREVVRYMINKLYFELDEIEYSVGVMLSYSHNGIHYGTNRTLLFTYNKIIETNEKAS